MTVWVLESAVELVTTSELAMEWEQAKTRPSAEIQLRAMNWKL